MDTTTFIDSLRQQLAVQQRALPVFNPVALQVQRELLKKDPNLQTIEQLISGDPSLSGNLLRIANSSLYQGLVPTTTVRSALIRLGMVEVQRIMLADASHSRGAQPLGRQYDGMMQQLWRHARGCAFAAGMLATALDGAVAQDEAFSAGLLHDIGKLPVLQAVARKNRQRTEAPLPESLVLAAMEQLHAEHGAQVLREIQVTEAVVEVARDHHQPMREEDPELLLVVRAANSLCHRLGIGLAHEPELDVLATPEGLRLGLSAAVLTPIVEFLTTTDQLTV